MAELHSLARPYAQAAIRQAQEETRVELWSDMLTFLAGVTRDRAMAGIIIDRRVPAVLLTELILEVCGGRLSASGENFVRLLIENGRLGLASTILEIFERLRAESEGHIKVELHTAYPVNAKYEQDIGAALQRKLNREVEFETRIDKSLIGGVVIKAGDLVIDASVKGRLAALTTELSK